MNFYIADTHIGHSNVIRFDDRPFYTVEEMDSVLMTNWNNKVSDDDDIYIIGDLIYRTNKDFSEYLDNLNGKKHLIVGNHDEKLLKDKRFRSYFVEIADIKQIFDKDRKVVLCHYPMVEWPSYFRGAYHLFGHIHNNQNDAWSVMKTKENAINVGCMLNGYEPLTLDELIARKRFQ